MDHTKDDLRIYQALPLEMKIKMTKERIKAWYEYWQGDVYLSFSGGKDSTVLKHIIDGMYDIPSVFVNTGLEYPEIQKFAMSQKNVVTVRPTMRFDEVILKYGYPVISKEISDVVEGARHNKNSRRYEKLFGIPSNFGEKYNAENYSYLYDAPFEISPKCCNVMKKAPARKYAKETGRKPIVATMCEESMLRETAWLRYGCNAFEGKTPRSAPMSFWTEQDVLRYLKKYNVPYCEIYGDIVQKSGIEGQTCLTDIFGNEVEFGELETTGAKRTGCMFCMFGCVAEKESRLVRLKETHPKQYEFIMKPKEKGGLGYKEVIDWINEHGNLNIKY